MMENVNPKNVQGKKEYCIEAIYIMFSKLE